MHVEGVKYCLRKICPNKLEEVTMLEIDVTLARLTLCFSI